MLSLLPLGVGRGADGVLKGQCSSSLVVVEDGVPILLVDLGFGVTQQFLKRFGRFSCPVYVSHNHSDHAAELPVVGAVVSAAGQRLALLAEEEVLDRIRQHRLHELISTGAALETHFDFTALKRAQKAPLSASFEIKPVRAKHAELTFGFLLYRSGRAVLGVSTDSGSNEALYDELAGAPLVVLDGRERGSKEHAAFSDIEAWAAKQSDVSVWVTGYGETEYVSRSFSLVRPGVPITIVG